MSAPRKPADMAYTVDVLVASALARADLQSLRGQAERRFEFKLLAAAGHAVPGLPEAGWHDLRRLLKVEISPLNQELRLSMQAEGYAALQRVARQSARLYSADGRIDLRVSFDATGRALAVLTDTAAIRGALGHFYVMLETPADPAPPATDGESR